MQVEQGWEPGTDTYAMVKGACNRLYTKMLSALDSNRTDLLLPDSTDKMRLGG